MRSKDDPEFKKLFHLFCQVHSQVAQLVEVLNRIGDALLAINFDDDETRQALQEALRRSFPKDVLEDDNAPTPRRKLQ